MRLFAPLALLLLAGTPALSCGPERLERSMVARLGPGADIVLTDGRILRLVGLHDIEAGQMPLRPGDRAAHGILGERDRWGRFPAIVFALPEGEEPVFLQGWLAASGRALIRPDPALGDCWTLLRQAEAKAVTQPDRPAEPGRYARVEGRVLRIGEGRTAHFIAIAGPPGARVTGLVQKRNLARLKRNGVDLPALTGHIVRLRGVRSLRNPQVIAVTRAEQIEIVR